MGPIADVMARPSKHHYFMLLALTARSRADCAGRHVGAVIVRDDRIISTGYNGTPIGMANCSEGGCHRCAHPEDFKAGSAYDLCICVHAEQNALLAAARFGQSVLGASLYTTLRPCFGCLKEALQAGIAKITYLDEWELPKGDALAIQYDRLSAQLESFERAEGVEWGQMPSGPAPDRAAAV